MALNRIERRRRVHYRIRKHVNGTAERPRLVVFRSNKQIYAQVVDDEQGRTLCAAASNDKELAAQCKGKTGVEAAAIVGKAVPSASTVADTFSTEELRVWQTLPVKAASYSKRKDTMANTNVKRVKTSDLELKDRLVAIQRVTKVTKGGRHFRFAAIVVVGDEKGVVGYGLGKANEVTAAIAKGVEDAKKNLVKIPVINTTIPHEQEAKFGGSRVFMKPAAPGTGVKAGGAMRAVFESVGIQNVLAKSKGSSNPHNLVKATVAALTQMRDAYTVAGLRGVPMSKVFNG